MVLAKQGLDLYGNKVKYEEYPGGGSLLTIEKEDQKSPIFWYEVMGTPSWSRQQPTSERIDTQSR